MYISLLPIRLNHDHARRTDDEEGATISGLVKDTCYMFSGPTHNSG